VLAACGLRGGDAEAQVRREGRFDHARPLERDVYPGHPVEQALAGTPQHRRDRQRELIHQPRRQVLAEQRRAALTLVRPRTPNNQIGAAHHDRVPASCVLACPRERVVDAAAGELEGLLSLTILSCGRWVTTNTGIPKPGSSPHPLTTPYTVRPLINAAPEEKTSSR
jgi:hypothetical protein